MPIGGQDNVKHIRRRLLQHVRQVIKRRNTNRLRAAQITVANPHQCSAVHALPASRMELAEVPRAKASDPHRHNDSAAITAAPACAVPAVPPMSAVTASPASMTAST